MVCWFLVAVSEVVGAGMVGSFEVKMTVDVAAGVRGDLVVVSVVLPVEPASFVKAVLESDAGKGVSLEASFGSPVAWRSCLSGSGLKVV